MWMCGEMSIKVPTFSQGGVRRSGEVAGALRLLLPSSCHPRAWCPCWPSAHRERLPRLLTTGMAINFSITLNPSPVERVFCMIIMLKMYSFSFDLIFLSWESCPSAWFSREVARSLWVQGAPVFAGSTQVDQNIFLRKEDNGPYDYPIYLCNKRNK